MSEAPESRWDTIIGDRRYKVRNPIPLEEQHENCPAWWGLLSDDGYLCCAVCNKELGKDERA